MTVIMGKEDENIQGTTGLTDLRCPQGIIDTESYEALSKQLPSSDRGRPLTSDNGIIKPAELDCSPSNKNASLAREAVGKKYGTPLSLVVNSQDPNKGVQLQEAAKLYQEASDLATQLANVPESQRFSILEEFLQKPKDDVRTDGRSSE